MITKLVSGGQTGADIAALDHRAPQAVKDYQEASS
jgi:hypothetical protein